MATRIHKSFYVVFLIASIATVFVATAKAKTSFSTAVQAVGLSITIILAIAGIYATAHRFFHKKILKFETWSRMLEEERGGGFAAILAILVALAVSKWTFTLLEYLVVCHIYGHDAWVHGLRVAHKSVLSNGDILSGWASLILNFGTFIATALCALGSYWFFRFVGFRMQGRRLSDPKPKRKWKSSGQSDSAS